MSTHRLITAFEHELVRVDGALFRNEHLDTLERWLIGRPDLPFTVERRGIRFVQYVGVLQVDDLTIEVLPKLDRDGQLSAGTREQYRRALYRMLQVSGHISARIVGKASVKLAEASLLDIFYEEYLRRVEELIRSGLVKQYRTTEENVQALRGRILFGESAKRNAAHEERHYCAVTRYTANNLFNGVISAALTVVASHARVPEIGARASRLALSFDSVDTTPITRATFQRIRLTRKTESYRSPFELARLILLGTSPTLSRGADSVVSILFDMNQLYETYVVRMFKRAEQRIPGLRVRAQRSKRFWEHKLIRPDILIEFQGVRSVVDTNWKVPLNNNPSDADLKQMYAYNRLWHCEHSHLLYPATASSTALTGTFSDGAGRCSMSFIDLFDADSGKLKNDLSDIVMELVHPFAVAPGSRIRG